MTGLGGTRSYLLFLGVLGALLLTGCRHAPESVRIPALFDKPPMYSPPRPLRPLDEPVPPDPISSDIVINLPMQPAEVDARAAIMRKGAVIRPNSSVVISVPASAESPDRVEGQNRGEQTGFRTDGYFHVLEQYIERGLLAADFHVKDRSKFEAKLRDLRSGSTVDESSYQMALKSLAEQLERGEITEEQFVEKSKALREKNLNPGSHGIGRGREEMTDISEVIRAAQDGDVMADYVLQVNALSVEPYAGADLQLSTRPEVREALVRNPGLRVGNSRGSTVPATLKQPWFQARFNAKLIDVKTGSIDWIGEYGIGSLSVLEAGVTVRIGIRRRVANAGLIVGAVRDHNERLRSAYEEAMSLFQKLAEVTLEGTKSYTLPGGYHDVQATQQQRQAKIDSARAEYDRSRSTYERLYDELPPERRLDWDYTYDVDAPTVAPDLMREETDEEKRRLIQHVQDLGFKVTHDLLSTVKVSAE